MTREELEQKYPNWGNESWRIRPKEESIPGSIPDWKNCWDKREDVREAFKTLYGKEDMLTAPLEIRKAFATIFQAACEKEREGFLRRRLKAGKL